MLKINNYHVAKSVSEAYALLIKGRGNAILGGAMWQRMSNRQVSTMIDISKLGLDKIEVEGDFIKIGALVTLSEVEKSEVLEEYYANLFKDMTHHIVGTQFRNTATIGGSVFGRYGFSDILTALLPLNTIVKTFKRGEVKLENFAEMEYEQDILEYIKIPAKKTSVSYKTFRNQATDFPVLCVCVSKIEGIEKISVGARPQKAKLVNTLEEALELNFGSNMRASAEYRRSLCEVLVQEALMEV